MYKFINAVQTRDLFADVLSDVVLFTEPYRASACRCGRTSEGDHFLDGQAEFEPVQRVADANLPLNLRVRQVSHDGAALHIGTTCCHVPRWHPHPQLDKQKEDGNGNTCNVDASQVSLWCL